MRGAATPSEIRKNIEWALALYEFSGYIDMKDVREGALKDPGNLLWFINDRRDQYPNLYAWIQKEVPQPKALRERTV
jgi:hypothetical protein